MSKHDGFFDNHERDRSPKQGGRQDDFGSLKEEGDDGYNVFVEKPKGQSNGARIMNARMVGRHGYEDRQRYRVKAQIPIFLRNLDLEAMLDWLYEVDKFFDIMDVPQEEEVNIVVYKISGGDGDWWQNVQENRKRQGKYPINTWLRMKRMINDRCNLKETKEKTAAMYITVLSQSIQDELKLLPIYTIDQSQFSYEVLASKSGVKKQVITKKMDSNPYSKIVPPECFKCSLPCHRCDECPNRKLNAYVWEHYGGDTKIDFGDDLEHIDKFAQVEGEVVNLMVQRTLCATNIEDFPQRNKIFETKCLIEDHVCSLITNGGSYENLVSKEIVKAMKLPTQQHPKPYKLGWINKGPMVKVNENIAILLNGRPPDLKTLFVRLLVEDGENSRASSFQVRGNDRT
ncbi:hypothetical protein Tco_0937543 [Tanacetum coccineum]|uniref:Uncharacterized protein n=1 Tax=Tanacetum coccineum TaxID=301880 RepID=A0ABQ5DHB7_9ASTR